MQSYHTTPRYVDQPVPATASGLDLLPTGELARRLQQYKALRDTAGTPAQRRWFTAFADEARMELRRRRGEIRLVAA